MQRERTIDESIVGAAASALQFGASVLPSNDASTDAAGSFLEFDENAAAEVGCESPQTEPDVVFELQRKIGLLETQLADCQKKLNEAEKENALLLLTSIFHR